jgi:adenosylcobinamide-phosphate synthase
MSAGLLAIAMVADAVLGEPPAIWNRLPHPAVLMGRVIDRLDKRWNRGLARRLMGVAATAVLVAGGAILGLVLHLLPDAGLIEAAIVAVLLAQKSLVDHVRAVATALRQSLPEGRKSVAMIVGRDTKAMTAPDIARAAIESAAENLSDGVIAPIFWYLIAGLPGIIVYKVVNTADSMIGHRTPKYEAFGWAAARLDDVLNLIPARLTAVLIAVTHRHFDSAPILRDGPLHRSPNAGWPEAAMAVVLNVALSGPRSYHGQKQDFPWVWPEGRRDPGPREIDAACTALWRAWGGMLVLVVLIWWA